MVVQRIVKERVEAVSHAFSELSIGEVMEFEERVDRQYTLLSSLGYEVGYGKAAVAAILVGLASYRLAMKGEEWWECFYRFMSRMLVHAGSFDDVVLAAVRFIDNCKGAVLGRDAKRRRIVKAARGSRQVLESVMNEPRLIVSMPSNILETLRTSLGERGYRKTVVFALKIGYYAVRPIIGRVPLRLDVPIPVDARVACITFSSGMVEARGYGDILRKPELAQRAWSTVSTSSGIPVLHLDTVLWVIGWAPRDLGLAEAKRYAEETLSRVFGTYRASRLVGELIRRECRETRQTHGF